MTEALLTLIPVVALLLGSPGPAPLALAAVGASFGISRGLPFLIGILSGLAVAIIGAAVGLSALFSTYPSAKISLQIAGSIYILYVAFKIAFAPVINDANTKEKIPTFLDGFILNLLNPKAYAAFLAIFSQFVLPLESRALSLIATGVICIIVAAIVDTIWLMLGGIIRPIFKKPLQARMLRLLFAALMIVAVGWTISRSFS